MSRRLPFSRAARLAPLAVLAIAGCTTELFRVNSKETPPAASEERGVEYVGDLMGPYGLNFLKVESVALVNGLNATGSDPRPSPQKEWLIDEMQTYDVKSPAKVLASPNTSLVIVRGYIPPAAQKGDLFDVHLYTGGKSETTSLAGGWLMPSRLRRAEVLGGSLRTGDVSAEASGDVLIEAIFEGEEDPVLATRGRVLEGGVVRRPRPLGLVARRDSKSIRTTSLCSSAINSRFYTYARGGGKQGAAEPKDDKMIELSVPRPYRHNVVRFFAVIRNLAVSETPGERMARLQVLQQQLHEPSTAGLAALRLEAIGKEAGPALKSGLASADPLVRFYAAEALAYMDDVAAAAPLAEASRREPAFRWHAMTALAAMSHLEAGEALEGLLHSTSAETRYGAFRAMRVRSPDDPLVAGETLDGQFHYHLISTTGEPMIHFSKSRRAEIVLFGPDQRMKPPGVISAGKDLMIRGVGPDQIKVLRFSPGKDTQHEYCSTRIDDLIRAIVRLGGGYAEVLQVMQEALAAGHLTSRLAIDALPRPGRRYYSDGDDPAGGPAPATPLPELFNSGEEPASEGGGEERIERPAIEEEEERGGLWGRFSDWFEGDE